MSELYRLLPYRCTAKSRETTPSGVPISKRYSPVGSPAVGTVTLPATATGTSCCQDSGCFARSLLQSVHLELLGYLFLARRDDAQRIDALR
jgi:hypothetical protein